MRKKKRKTLGQKALELLAKDCDLTPIEVGEELGKLASKKLDEVIRTHKSFGDEYYIQIVFQQENFHRKWLPNVHHFQSIVTSQYPGMRPDRSCWKYNNREDKRTYLWALPDLKSCAFIIQNEKSLAPEEMELLGHVKKFLSQCCGAIQRKNIASLNI